MASIAAQLAKDRYSSLGIGTNQNPVKYLNQDYEQLRAQCLATSKLFEDPAFPVVPSSLGFCKLGPNSETVQDVVWKRPAEIKEKPQFINEDEDRADVRQGELSDCWVLSSIAALTLNKDRLNRVVPVDQSFDNYAGIFHFKFWQYGQWVDVVVDDRLPTRKGKLLFVKSTAACEFWSALLEKAYAKLNGSYEAIDCGLPVEALEDFTGGVGELYECENAPNNLFQIIRNALKAKSMVACDTRWDVAVNTNLVQSHGYTIIAAEEVSYRGNKVQIVRTRNPWGFLEWTGPWSDNAPEWNEVDPDVKARLNLKGDDGETWMSFSSLLAQFARVEICHLNLRDVCCSDRHKWSVIGFNGKWTSGVTAGGRKDFFTFYTNPQFRITLENPDGDYAEGNDKPSCTVLISLMQKDRRRKRPQIGNLFRIGFYIYKVIFRSLNRYEIQFLLPPGARLPTFEMSPKDQQLGRDFFRRNTEAALLDTYNDHREVSKRFWLPAGNYVIIPTTYSPREEADFYLRVISEKMPDAVEVGDVVEANLYESSPELKLQNGGQESDEELRSVYNVEDLSRALKKKLSKYADIKSDGFSLRTCREMINLTDMDNNGNLSSEEYKVLCMKLENYMKIFLEVDANHSGTIDAHEMRNALQRGGFNLNTRIQEVIVQRYVSNELSIGFEDFIACLVRLENLFKMFNILDADKNGSITLSLPETLAGYVELIRDLKGQSLRDDLREHVCYIGHVQEFIPTDIGAAG
ncbi:calpain-8-like [Mantella aurantiaca]